jgi:hypothetical protein
MLKAIIRIVVATFLLPILVGPAQAAPTEEHLARYLMVEDVQIMRAMTETDLSLARYRDAGPVIILEVGRSARHLFYYTEVNDLGGILLSASLDFSDIKTILQAHSITCQDILAALEGEPIFSAPCLPLR